MPQESKTLEGSDEAPFNMAMLFYIEVNRLIAKKNDAYIAGDIMGWYRCLKSMYGMVRWKIEAKDSKGTLNEEFVRARNMLESKAGGSMQARVQKMSFFSAEKILDEVEHKLLSAMDKKHMIFPSIDGKGLDSLRRKYGLSEESK